MDTPTPERKREYALDAARYDFALLRELRLRVADQVKDLGEEVGNRRPDGVKNCIHFLVWHLCDGEGLWLSKFDASLKGEYEALFARRFTKDDRIPRAAMLATLADSSRLLDLYEKSAHVKSIPPRFGHERAALAHLHWHWTYHSGQVGLLRVMLGHPYVWRFAE